MPGAKGHAAQAGLPPRDRAGLAKSLPASLRRRQSSADTAVRSRKPVVDRKPVGQLRRAIHGGAVDARFDALAEDGPIMVLLHIAAGLLALIAGAAALFARKGGALHRKSGAIFAYAMLAMSSTGALMAALKGERISVIAGVLTFYLVSTGLLAVRRPLEKSRGIIAAFMLVAVAVAAAAVAIGVEVKGNAKTAGWAPMFFVFGSVALVGALLDARLLFAGAIQGAHRLARHLWRMGFALFIANASFFLGQAKLLPPQWRNFAVLALPVIAVLLVTAYWLVRVHWKRPATKAHHSLT